MISLINNNYLSCYLHDLFKSIIVRGGQERRDCDITASISEQSSEFAKKDINERLTKNLEKLPSIILNPITLSPVFYIDSEGNLFVVNFTEQFEKQAEEYVKYFLNYKYGNKIYDRIKEKIIRCAGENINKCEKLSSDEFVALIDANRFMAQRSWISANDISIHAHLRGALLALLDNVVLIRLYNPFYSDYKTLKDLEGVYAVTKIFLYYLNDCLLRKLANVGLNDAIERIANDLPKDKYNTPLIDFYTPFIFDADDKSILLFYVKDRLNDIRECARLSFVNTINEVIGSLSHSKVKETITLRVDLLKEREKILSDPEALNDFLNIPSSISLIEIENLEVEFNGLDTTDELCSVCKLRKGIKEELIPNVVSKKEDEKLCNVCLAVRLAPYVVGRTSALKRGDIGNVDIKNEGWYNLFKKVDSNVGRSIDELTEGYEDDVIFLGIRLDLENWKDISVSLFKAYNVDLNALYGLVDNYLKDLIRKSSEYLLDFTRKENLITSINTISECYNQLKTNSEMLRKLEDSFIGLLADAVNSNKIDINRLAEKILNACGNINDEKSKLHNIIKNSISNLKSDLNNFLNKIRSDNSTLLNAIYVKNNIINHDSLAIPRSLDRQFSIKQSFSMIIEYIMALLYIKKVDHITLIVPSITTPLFLAVIRKRDFKKLFEEVLYPVFKKLLENSKASIPNAILTYFIKAKAYTPIHIINEVINIKPRPIKESSVLLVPVIVNRNNLPITELIGVNIDSFKEIADFVEREVQDKESLISLLRSSAEDLPYPAFESCSKLPVICNDIINKWKRGKAFSIHYDDDTKLKGYVARLLQ
ncbi:hypothetical protein [Saccharolobus islandicus]|nr:hypothetical protein [Sulfolobus islandicus]